MRFTINLATRFHVNHQKLVALLVSVLLILFILLVANFRNITTNVEELETITKNTAQLEARRQETGKPVSQKEYENLLAQIRFANEIIDKKGYNWLTLLNRLEAVVPAGLAISAIQPELKDNGVKLSGVARSFNDLRTFMENVEASDVFSDLFLLSQAEVKLNDNSTGITFNLSCKVAM